MNALTDDEGYLIDGRNGETHEEATAKPRVEIRTPTRNDASNEFDGKTQEERGPPPPSVTPHILAIRGTKSRPPVYDGLDYLSLMTPKRYTPTIPPTLRTQSPTVGKISRLHTKSNCGGTHHRDVRQIPFPLFPPSPLTSITMDEGT